MIEQDSHTLKTEAGAELETFYEYQGRMPAIGVIGILTHLASRKWLIAKTSGIAMVAGVVLSLTLPVRYTATTRIMPPQQTPSTASMLMNQLTGSGGMSIAAAAGGGLGLKNPNDIYLGLLKSRPIADAIIRRFGLVSAYQATDMTTVRKALAGSTQAASEESGLLAISVTDKDKTRAADLANAYTEELRVITKNLAVTEASQRRLFYEEQLKHAKDDLIAAAFSLQQIQQKKGLIQLDAQAKAMITNLAALHAQIAAKEVEVQVLKSYSTERNPEVQLAESQLSSLQQEAARLEQHSQSPGSPNLGLEDIPGAGLEYLRAEHELQYRQILFDMLVKQYDAARLDEAKEAAVIQVVEPAIPPDQKSSPHRALIVLLFAILGFLASCSYLLVSYLELEYPDFSRSLAQFRSALLHR
jgi:tyrosine-protein kinase Etk/Wzc